MPKGIPLYSEKDRPTQRIKVSTAQKAISLMDSGKSLTSSLRKQIFGNRSFLINILYERGLCERSEEIPYIYFRYLHKEYPKLEELL